MIQVTCPECNHSLNAPDEFAGRKAKCRKCGQVMRVPSASVGRLPVVRSYRIEKTLLGKYVAAYQCPHCKGPLRSEETEISGGEESCPECGESFRVSTKAVADIRSRREDDENAKAAQKQEREDTKRRKAEEREEARKQKNEARELATIEARKNVARRQKPELVPRQRTAVVPSADPAGLMPCPYCGESIKASAIKCRFCGEMLHAQRQSGPAAVTQVIVNNQRARKSAGLAFVLAFLFGPLGMLYSTVPGALAMILVNIFLIIPTFGFILLLTWPIGCIWAAMAANDG
jgi:uncharacterized Zn finger protein (UPF0148 family)